MSDQSESLTAAALASHRAGNLAQAESLYARAVAADPQDARALHFLGLLKHQRGDRAGAEPLVRQAVALDSSKALYQATLGDVLGQLGRWDEALALLAVAAEKFPESPWVLHNYGFALLETRRFPEAVPVLKTRVRLQPDQVDGLLLLGRALLDVEEAGDAVAVLERALALAPASSTIQCVLANAYREVGESARAMALYESALVADPKNPEALHAYASILQDSRGDIAQAVALYRRAMAADPGCADHHSNLLLSMHYRSEWAPEQVFEEHVAHARIHADYPQTFVHQPRPAGRRLRVGYVSGDFRNHAVAYFWESLAKHHDHGKVEVFCYSNVDFPDASTRRLQAHADHWREIQGWKNAKIAEQIHADQIDVLVDLAGHSGRRCLEVFARKPAPVQVTYLGYPNTTGLASMDYRLVDALTDPPGLTERHHTEALVRLPGCFLCYTPPTYAPAVAMLPAAGGAPITFASFNTFKKISPEWVGLAAGVLQKVPGSRLLIKGLTFRMGDGTRETIARWFAAAGIGQERIIWRAAQVEQADHLACYGEVDIALDTYPYHGTTTTCEALWMGVPVVTLAGPTHVSRVGVSLMTAAGLPDFVAQTPEEFVRIAVAKAGDLDRLAEIRRTMRERMKPLTDGPAYAIKLEAAYQAMWEAKAPR